MIYSYLTKKASYLAFHRHQFPSKKLYVNMKSFNQLIILLIASSCLMSCNTAEKIYYDYKDSRAKATFANETNGVTIYKTRSLAKQNSKVRLMPTKFTGYSFLLTVEEEPLNMNHNYFKQFGGIMMYKTVLDEYAYYLGAFQTEDEINQFYENVLQYRIPEAIIVRFENGQNIGF